MRDDEHRKADAVETRLSGRSALITGAAGGIGRAVAAALAAEGVRVALLDREAPRALADELTAGGAEAIALAVDVTDDAAVGCAVAAASDHFGGLDLVAACAGISGPVGTALVDTRPEQWAAVFAVNVGGTYSVLRHALPVLERSDAASVVVVASDSALVAAPGMAAYCASKAAVLQLVRAASTETERVRINAVCPSIVDSPMSRGDLGLPDGFAGVGYPVQTAAEVAAEVVFLCSPLSRAVNAAALVSDFGYTARSNFPA